MAAWVAPVISGAASLLGGLFGNSAKRKEAAKDRAFQLQMAQNAHQYEVEDLRKAGLNPILSGTGGPGARASGGSRADQSDLITPAVHSALSAQRQQQELENLKATEQNTVKDTELKDAQRRQVLGLTSKTAVEESHEWEKLNVTVEQRKKVSQEIANLKASEAAELQRKLLLVEQTEGAKNSARLTAIEAEVQEWMHRNGMQELSKIVGAGQDVTAILRMLNAWMK